MTYAIHRNLLVRPPNAVRGDGVYVIDADGNRYLDGCGGAAVSCLGHNHPNVIHAIRKQAEALPYAHTSFFSSDAMEMLAERLVTNAPGMGKVLLLSGGSEAIEAALKLSRQYFVEAGEPDRHLYIARRQSYHGNTLGALSVGGNEWRRAMYAPIMVPGNHIAPCFAYREQRDHESLGSYALRAANELEDKINELGAGNVAAFVAETVVGATAGAVDEVMCGTGRTGTMMAYEQEGICPDIVTMAKGLAAGYQPVGAVLCTDQIIDVIRDGTGFFQHGHTFMGHATAVAASLATLQAIESENLLENVRVRGASLQQRLRAVLGDHPNVGDVRGRGLFIGIEFVKDRATKEPLDPAAKTHNRLQKEAMSEGLMVYGMGGTIDGRSGDHVLIAPPYILSESEQEELVDKLARAVNRTCSE
jgi:adenosylmethionine-8-amino-7-oxononanoate aminotransferase